MRGIINRIWKFIKQIGLYGILFFITVYLIAAVNVYKIADYVINNQKVNNEWSAEGGDRIETIYLSFFGGREQFVNSNGGIRRLLGQREMNNVVKLDNNYLATTMQYRSDEVLKEYADSIVTFDRYLKSKGIPLIYASTPYTVSKYDTQLPEGKADYGNNNIDRLLGFLSESGVEVLDFRETMKQDGIDQYELMYKTDHHWTTEAGFYAFRKLADRFEKLLDFEISDELKNQDNYDRRTYQDSFLGSRGQRVGKLYAGNDDFELFVPKFETLVEKDGIKGTMPELAYDQKWLSENQYNGQFLYDYVLGGSLANYKNLSVTNNKKLLIVTDSMGKAVNPYLILSFKEVMTVSNHDVMNLKREVIEQFDPDMVLLLYYPGQLEDNRDAFKFGINFEES